MLNLIKNLNNILDDFFPTFGERDMGMIKTDIKENADCYLLEMKLPGINKEGFKVSIDDNVLMVEVERNLETNTKDEKVIRRERLYGKYSRSFRINNIDLENIDATFKDVILTLTVKKTKEDSKKLIEVK